MLANLAEGLPLLVWDNIATGSVIRCPTLEKVLTSSRYADRSLGETRRRTVPAQTIMALTGNNLRPAGDLASRTLLCRLDVDRVDPENRSFRHVDPIAWTVQNPGELLRALYTIVLANPQLKTPVEPQTRFKEWWHLVGSAIEHAAAELRRLAPEAVPHPVILKASLRLVRVTMTMRSISAIYCPSSANGEAQNPSRHPTLSTGIMSGAAPERKVVSLHEATSSPRAVVAIETLHR